MNAPKSVRADRKTIAVFVDASPSGQKRAAHAAAIAQRWGADVVGVQVVGPEMMPGYMYNARGDKAAESLIAYERRLASDARATEQLARKSFQALCAGVNVPGEFSGIGRDEAEEGAILNAFQSDLVVVGHPAPDGLPEYMAPERILLESGGPLLIIPNAWAGETIGEKVVIGWNATRVARHAVADALGFLVTASSVIVLLIDPVKRWGHGQEPGGDVALYLTRHGVSVAVEKLTTHGLPVAEALLAYVQQHATDLLVLGAYSHARLREVLLGGVTRTLLTRLPVPVLISR